MWLYLGATRRESKEFVRTQADIDRLVCEALFAEDRPRSMAFGDGLLAIFRGVNLNRASNPEDMVSIRVWVHGARILSTFRPDARALCSGSR
jgi:zinc transporter